MQLMSWTVARLGSRFSLLFEPYRRRVMHSALGRFLDLPLDLMVGLVEPDGTERVLPFTRHGVTLFNPEQFERLNSVTFRGYSQGYRLRFEFNVHSVFYPQDERLCLMPAFYLEMRVNPAEHVRWTTPVGPTPARVKLFLRLDRPHTRITTTSSAGGSEGGGRIDLTYRNTLRPRLDPADGAAPGGGASPEPLDPAERAVEIHERIVSLNTGPGSACAADPDGKGLTLDLPVTEPGSGVKWRLVWAAFCGDPILEFPPAGQAPARVGRFRYLDYWKGLDDVIEEAMMLRDDRLAHSRRLEKLAEQSPLRNAERHLLNQSFQSFLSNTFWCRVEDAPAPAPGSAPGSAPGTAPATQTPPAPATEWFSVWDGSRFHHSPVDVGYSCSPFFLTLWPRLLAVQCRQWARYVKPHAPSGGAYLHHDLGRGMRVAGQAFGQDMPVEVNADFLLMLQALVRYTGETALPLELAGTVEALAKYLLWADRDRSGFATEGVANAIVDGGPAIHLAGRQTYLAIKRLAALNAAADLLGQGRAGAGDDGAVRRCERAVEGGVSKVETAAWLGDHFAVCVDPGNTGVTTGSARGGDAWSDSGSTLEQIPGADAYSIYTSNGLLLPMLCGQPTLFDPPTLLADLTAALRETLGPYGCGHTSVEPDGVWVSQNLWRDCIARYLGMASTAWVPNYWDLQVMSNTHQQSLGWADTYIGNHHVFSPRGIASMGVLWAYPRLVIDRLAAGGPRISVDPDRHYPQRWPLFPLADWKAGKVPICVVGGNGRVTIEGESDPVIIRGDPAATGVIG